MKRVFDHPVKGRQAKSQLLDLQQGHLSVSGYALEFCILAVESGWEDSALQAVFLKGLSDKLKDELALQEECGSLNSLIDLAIQLDNRIRERERQAKKTFPGTRSCSPVPRPRNSNHPVVEPSSSPTDEPMQLGHTGLTPAERQRRIRNQLCLYCGQGGHYLSKCPEVPKVRAPQ